MKIYLTLFILLLTAGGNAQTTTVSGRFYYDLNGNHVFDGSDSALANRQVRALYSSGVYQTYTNAAGQYSFLLPPGSYDIGHYGYIDEANYKDTGDQHRVYSGGSDIVNFAYQRRDSIENVTAYLDYNIFDPVQPSGVTKTYKIYYGYDGFLQNMPAVVQLRFNPMVSFVNASSAPTVNSGGKLEWNIASLQRNVFSNRPFDSITVSLHIPAVGDTIGFFKLNPKLIPGVTVTNNYYKYSYNTIQPVQFPEQPSSGTTAGVKWLREFDAKAQFFHDYLNSVDTSQNGENYFVSGERSVDDTLSFTSRYLPFIAKLNKDGLSVWEKHIDSAAGTLLFNNVAAIKHSPDGGVIVLGSLGNTDSSSGYPYFNRDVKIAKFDTDGNLLWTKKLGGSKYEDPGYNLEVLADGSSVFTGNTASHDLDFANNNPDTTNDNLFVSKISSSGALLFTKVYGGSKYDYGSKVKVLQNGNIVVLASTESNNGDVSGAHTHYYIDPVNSDTVHTEEAWILNLSANGDMLWNRCYGGSKYSYFTGVAENNGGLLLTGSTDSKNGDLPYYPEASVSLWALQVSGSNGNILWSKLHKLYKGYQDSNYVSYPDYIYDNYPYSSLHKTKDGNFVVGCAGSDMYGTIRGKHGDADIVLIKLSTNGDIIWQKAIGGSNQDYVEEIQTDRNDDIVFVGSSSSENDDLYKHLANISTYMLVGKAGITNIIKGSVFVDNNGNHLKDPGEYDYSEGRVNSIKTNDTISARIFDGKYLNNVDTGNYVTSYKPVNNYYVVFPASHNTVFTGLDLTDSVDFALVPKPNINDLEVQLLPLSIPRPGFDGTYRVITKNVGTTTISNTVIGFVKDSRQSYAYASRPENGIAADSIWWGPFTLNAFDIDTLYVTLTNDAPPSLNNGDTLTVKVTANPVAGDSSQNNNRFSVRERVRGSFDPNDKSEIHAGTLSTTQYVQGDFLQYQIRFQNTGTDTAFFITVKDTLQAKLDLSSMEIISASHPFTFRLNGNVATWDFKNIKLPDSTTDEPGSHGFIIFKIKPKTGLVVGDVFSNNAAIYFDYNLPVITNQDNTVIGTNAGVCPNGNTSFTAGISGSTYQWQVNNGTGFINLSNTGIYSGVNTSTLSLTGASTALYGYRYRCLVDGSVTSPENILKFAVQWTGAIDANWENAANWNCNVLPDAKTDVIVPAVSNQPMVNSNAACYSLRLLQGCTVTVKTGFGLNITGKLN